MGSGSLGRFLSALTIISDKMKDLCLVSRRLPGVGTRKSMQQDALQGSRVDSRRCWFFGGSPSLTVGLSSWAVLAHCLAEDRRSSG